MAEEAKAPQLPDGTLAPYDASSEEYANLSPDAQKALTELCRKAAQRDMASRRFEVEQAWEARLFGRGYQHLLPRKGGGWQLPQDGQGGAYAARVTSSLLPTNVYSPYGQIITAALTREVPDVIWQPENPDNDGDITTAEASEDYTKVFRRVNDLAVMHTELAWYLWNDGRSLIYTRHVKDAQRFGYEEPEDQSPVVPETEGAPQSGQPAGNESPAVGGEQEGGTGNESGQPVVRTPRGQEIAEVFGKLEHKVPMNTKDLSQCHFCIISKEYDKSIAKAMCPNIADEIQPSAGPGENELDRIARINVSLAL